MQEGGVARGDDAVLVARDAHGSVKRLELGLRLAVPVLRPALVVIVIVKVSEISHGGGG
jgi:hypothetical protein